MVHELILQVTEDIIARSSETRTLYLDDMQAHRLEGSARKAAAEGNQAHAFAACPVHDKQHLIGGDWPNIAIVTAYNDMLSAHQPYERYPQFIREAARQYHATAQVAGGVPAMCDGVTQGREGMSLSLFSRDVIALSTAVALSHNVFDGALYLGICDKIVPGLVIGALQFGFLPSLFIPSGPMPSGLPNSEKARIRQLYAEGKASREDLLKAECESYHSAGTCTFYGTANSNQMMMEIMGLHLPGAAFVSPQTELRDALTQAAVKRIVEMSAVSGDYLPLYEVIDERSFVNAIIGLLATGGSTNLVLHIPAMAAAAGIKILPEDFDRLSKIIPLLARLYPNGMADINHFHAAGGMGTLTYELLEAGLLHKDVKTISGKNLEAYINEPVLRDGALQWRAAPRESGDKNILATTAQPFDLEGGICVTKGNLGLGIAKKSAVKPEHQIIEAPAAIFSTQEEVLAAFKAGSLDRDVIVVLRFQGPAANGMPELHKLMPALGVLQDKGFKIGLITDGRMSGASGKVPAVIHLSPEAAKGGNLARLTEGDHIKLDLSAGTLSCHLPEQEFEKRDVVIKPATNGRLGLGQDIFSVFRNKCTDATMGASSLEI